MALSTYDELKASIADFLNRDDLTAVIPDFIKLAEAKMTRDLRHWRQEDRATAVVDQQYASLPLNFVEPIRITIPANESHILELVGTLEISKLRAETSDARGRPTNYSVLDQSFELYPTPDADYTLELVYYESIPELGSLTTNWVLTYFPDAYLYGSLMQSSPYLQEDQRVQVWNALYQSAVSAINLEGESAKSSGSGRRIQIRSY